MRRREYEMKGVGEAKKTEKVRESVGARERGAERVVEKGKVREGVRV